MLHVASFYRFKDLTDIANLQAALLALCEQHQLLGTVLLANEGINGTLAGTRSALSAVLAWLSDELALASPLSVRWTQAQTAPFRRLKIRHKNEIVTLGRPDIKPHVATGKHLSAQEWNQLLDDPDTLLIDTRNHYEIEVGTFPSARDAGTDSFREFPAYAEALGPEHRERPVAMFCTGGIRCEKASALMLQLGFKNVHQLEGGILAYLEQTTAEDNHWRGECFVYDSRVAVDKDLSEGGYVQCHACRRPLSSEDLASDKYREGAYRPRCHESEG